MSDQLSRFAEREGFMCGGASERASQVQSRLGAIATRMREEGNSDLQQRTLP